MDVHTYLVITDERVLMCSRNKCVWRLIEAGVSIDGDHTEADRGALMPTYGQTQVRISSRVWTLVWGTWGTCPAQILTDVSWCNRWPRPLAEHLSRRVCSARLGHLLSFRSLVGVWTHQRGAAGPGTAGWCCRSIFSSRWVRSVSLLRFFEPPQLLVSPEGAKHQPLTNRLIKPDCKDL